MLPLVYEIIYLTILIVIGALILILVSIIFVIVRYYILADTSATSTSAIYLGYVKHARLKGEAMHAFQYPLFFTFIDISDIKKIGWKWWPIFRLNGGGSCFCSLEYKDHLKGFRDGNTETLDERLKLFLYEKSGGVLKDTSRVFLLSHLTYFGYCFNPISIYYIYGKAPESPSSPQRAEAVVAEVSNTPWNEQHSYVLHESIDGVQIDRGSSNRHNNGHPSFGNTIFKAEWKKEFHVSPFMEMDYKYSFTFGEPGDSLIVNSQMLKISTNDVWFSASFRLTKLPFSPLNLLYVLLFYPFHTRIIQVWIHWEAVKLFLKGVSIYNHPQDADVNFGFGITGKGIAKVIYFIASPFLICYRLVINMLTSSSNNKNA